MGWVTKIIFPLLHANKSKFFLWCWKWIKYNTNWHLHLATQKCKSLLLVKAAQTCPQRQPHIKGAPSDCFWYFSKFQIFSIRRKLRFLITLGKLYDKIPCMAVFIVECSCVAVGCTVVVLPSLHQLLQCVSAVKLN